MLPEYARYDLYTPLFTRAPPCLFDDDFRYAVLCANAACEALPRHKSLRELCPMAHVTCAQRRVITSAHVARAAACARGLRAADAIMLLMSLRLAVLRSFQPISPSSPYYFMPSLAMIGCRCAPLHFYADAAALSVVSRHAMLLILRYYVAKMLATLDA